MAPVSSTKTVTQGGSPKKPKTLKLIANTDSDADVSARYNNVEKALRNAQHGTTSDPLQNETADEASFVSIALIDEIIQPDDASPGTSKDDESPGKKPKRSRSKSPVKKTRPTIDILNDPAVNLQVHEIVTGIVTRTKAADEDRMMNMIRLEIESNKKHTSDTIANQSDRQINAAKSREDIMMKTLTEFSTSIDARIMAIEADKP